MTNNAQLIVQPDKFGMLFMPAFRHFNVATDFGFASVAASLGSGMSTRLCPSSKNESFPVFSGIKYRVATNTLYRGLSCKV